MTTADITATMQGNAVWVVFANVLLQQLGLSAADYGRLVGVSALTIYNWESGKSRPRRAQFAAIVAVRGIGKREAADRLASLADAPED